MFARDILGERLISAVMIGLEKGDWAKDRIGKVLSIILKDMQGNGIIQAPGIARLVLTLKHQVYESLYLTDQAENEKQCWHQAAISGDIENVRYLLETRPEADCIDACFYTAAIHDYSEICRFILRHSITEKSDQF